jgi:hypothetical protein
MIRVRAGDTVELTLGVERSRIYLVDTTGGAVTTALPTGARPHMIRLLP